MKPFLLFAVAALSLPTLSAQTINPWTFPSLDQVMEHVYLTYETEGEESELEFARKPEGWMLIRRNRGDYTHQLSEDLVWASMTQSYLPVSEKRRPPLARPELDYLKERYFRNTIWGSLGYERCAFYGYPDWAKDLISAYGQEASLSDLNLDGLSRAYEFLADQLLHAHYATPHPVYQPLGYERLEDGQRLTEFLACMEKAKETNLRLERQNPAYSLPAGDPFTDRCNTIMTTCLMLLSVQREDLVWMMLEDSLYSPSILLSARHQLDVCPPGAWLIANGDNDYFPLLYLQLRHKYRTDVVLSVYPFLSARWHAEQMAAFWGLSLTPGEKDALRSGYYLLPEGEPEQSFVLPGARSKVKVPIQTSGEQRYYLTTDLLLSKWMEKQAKSPSPTALCVSPLINPANWESLWPHFQWNGWGYQLMPAPVLKEQDPFRLLGPMNTAQSEKVIAEWMAAPEAARQRTGQLGLDGVISKYLILGFQVQWERLKAGKPLLPGWWETVEPLWASTQPTDLYLMVMSVVLAYEAGEEALANRWEGNVYDILSGLDWKQIPEEDPIRLIGLGSLRLLGYYFEESGRDTQAEALDQILAQWEERD